MDRYKMPRSSRAKQFAPFDALKGLSESLRIKEYEHDKILKGDLSEEKVLELSNILLNLNKNNIYNVTYFCDGYNKNEMGNIKLDTENNGIIIANTKIKLDDVWDIKIIK